MTFVHVCSAFLSISSGFNVFPEVDDCLAGVVSTGAAARVGAAGAAARVVDLVDLGTTGVGAAGAATGAATGADSV